MNKKRILLICIIGIVLLCVGGSYWHTQRQDNYVKGRKLFAPIYEYSGKLSPEDQKRFAELLDSITSVVGADPPAAIEYAAAQTREPAIESASDDVIP